MEAVFGPCPAVADTSSILYLVEHVLGTNSGSSIEWMGVCVAALDFFRRRQMKGIEGDQNVAENRSWYMLQDVHIVR